MKRFLLASLAVFTLCAAEAEKIQIGTLVVAGRSTLIEAATKVGELSCNIMLVGMLQGALSENAEEPTEYRIVMDDDRLDFDLVTFPTKLPEIENDSVVQITISADGVRKYCARENVSKDWDETTCEFIKDFDGAKMCLKIDDRGISAHGSFRVVEGSGIVSRFPTGTALPKNALEFAGRDSIIAMAVSENGGSDFSTIKKIVPVFERHGIKLDFLTFAGEGNDITVTMDLVNAIRSIQAQKAAFEQIDSVALRSDIEALSDNVSTTPSGRFSLALKGYNCPFTMQERLVATLPDVVDKPIVNEGVYSYYSILKAVIPVVVAELSQGHNTEQIKSMFASLPAERVGAVGYALWENSPYEAKFVFRISADEIKSFGMASGIIMASVMKAQMSSGGDIECIEESVIDYDLEDDDDED